MIVVKIELHSAITGRVSEIGRTYIWNDGTGSGDSGNYDVAVMRKGHYSAKDAFEGTNITRKGRVTNYPRLSYNVWRLITRALKSAFPEEGK